MPRVLTRQADVRKEMEDLLAALEAHADELSHLEVPRKALAELVRLVQELSSQLDGLRATKQLGSKQLQGALNEGKKLVTFLQMGVRQHYGNRNEKLLAFGVPPFRTRSREVKARPKPQAPETPETKPQVRPDAKLPEPES
jgi:hypothetical protein